jgi:hypothetical protein
MSRRGARRVYCSQVCKRRARDRAAAVNRPDRHREYYARNKEKMAEKTARWRQEHYDRVLIGKKRWREKYHDRLLVQKREAQRTARREILRRAFREMA